MTSADSIGNCIDICPLPENALELRLIDTYSVRVYCRLPGISLALHHLPLLMHLLLSVTVCLPLAGVIFLLNSDEAHNNVPSDLYTYPPLHTPTSPLKIPSAC